MGWLTTAPANWITEEIDVNVVTLVFPVFTPDDPADPITGTTVMTPYQKTVTTTKKRKDGMTLSTAMFVASGLDKSATVYRQNEQGAYGVRITEETSTGFSKVVQE